MVEHPAVNRRVGGSSPLRGANLILKKILTSSKRHNIINYVVSDTKKEIKIKRC